MHTETEREGTVSPQTCVTALCHIDETLDPSLSLSLPVFLCECLSPLSLSASLSVCLSLRLTLICSGTKVLLEDAGLVRHCQRSVPAAPPRHWLGDECRDPSPVNRKCPYLGRGAALRRSL